MGDKPKQMETESSSSSDQKDDLKLCIQRVPPENSLLHSMSYILNPYKPKSVNTYIRELIFESVMNTPARYPEEILGKSVSQYCSWILDPDSKLGEFEIKIISEYFGFEICLLDTKNNKIVRYEELKFPTRVFLTFDGENYAPVYRNPTKQVVNITTIFRSDDKQISATVEALLKSLTD